ncbi:hypothetical protein SDC9_124127 [bioreactor metagenome]|uniref:Uncharacterized protein n=1 Tax=bioreactor metagenome TaxID=1076179 RepID=A0A645CJJ9_9ZZZZ
MAVRRVDDYHVDSGPHERRRPVLGVAADADRRACAQPSVRIFRGVREGLRLEDVFYCDESLKFVLFVNDGEFFHL